MPEFKIEEGSVYFKDGGMLSFSHYGQVYASFPTGVENQYEIKKFNLDAEEYQHTDELTEFTIYGQTVPVVDGFAVIVPPEPEPEPPPEITNGDILQKLQEEEAENLIRDELLLEQQLLLLNIDLNTSM